MNSIAKVAVPGTKRPYFDYQIPHGQTVQIGQRVVVPLGRRQCVGLVVELAKASVYKGLKPLIIEKDYPVVLDPPLMALTRWMSQYYHVYVGDILQLLWPAMLRKTRFYAPWLAQYFQCTELGQNLLSKSKTSKVQKALLQATHLPQMGQDLQALGFGRRTVESCLKADWLKEVPKPPMIPIKPEGQCVLNDAQAMAVKTISKTNGFGVHVLHGVTGSGKTEVYCDAILACLKLGKQALVLVPEIGLTEQTVARFQKRCGIEPCVLHSHLSDEARWANWSKIHQEQSVLCIGTRSAIFAPFANLGLIVVDEEHDASYKQQSSVRYHARDVAIVRAKGLGIPIVLGSATPSLETLHNIEQKRYHCLTLAKRAVSGGKVTYQSIDMRGQKLEQGISQTMKLAIQKHLKLGEQVLVFINRRGFAPVLLCHSCGHTSDCPSCDAHLAWHSINQSLICHHCGYKRKRPSVCPSCEVDDWIEVGVGTQRLESSLQELFPDVALIRIDRDSTQQKGALDDKLSQVHQGEAQMLIGTQMVAKGHDFENIGLVVLVDVDGQLYHPDFRAIEQFAQLVVQVSGRAGRRGQQATVLLQTHHPNHPYLQTLLTQGYQALAGLLLADRQKAHLPPFYYQAILHIHSNKDTHIKQALERLDAVLTWDLDAVEVLGPMPSVMRKKAGFMQYQVVFSSASRSKLHAALDAWRQFCVSDPIFAKVRWWLDVDPISV